MTISIKFIMCGGPGDFIDATVADILKGQGTKK